MWVDMTWSGLSGKNITAFLTVMLSGLFMYCSTGQAGNSPSEQTTTSTCKGDQYSDYSLEGCNDLPFWWSGYSEKETPAKREKWENDHSVSLDHYVAFIVTSNTVQKERRIIFWDEMLMEKLAEYVNVSLCQRGFNLDNEQILELQQRAMMVFKSGQEIVNLDEFYVKTGVIFRDKRGKVIDKQYKITSKKLMGVKKDRISDYVESSRNYFRGKVGEILINEMNCPGMPKFLE